MTVLLLLTRGKIWDDKKRSVEFSSEQDKKNTFQHLLTANFTYILIAGKAKDSIRGKKSG